MCNNTCSRYERKVGDRNFYCQNCAKYIPKKNTHKETKTLGRRRCSCCNGLVRNKVKIFYTTSGITTI
jgi:hypothetical protein|tara:strand:+ start:12359 stop:12562 length:204 start_codon:yes stop_codon:yes gene_type:complete